VPTFPNAKYVFHKREYAAWKASTHEVPILTPGHSPAIAAFNISSRGQRAVVPGDMMHHATQCRELDWSPGVHWDPKQAPVSRRQFLSSVSDTKRE
jgi:glyoxylase-like metal-dependent hydrolase (beta-lactamase superfamily II)